MSNESEHTDNSTRELAALSPPHCSGRRARCWLSHRRCASVCCSPSCTPGGRHSNVISNWNGLVNLVGLSRISTLVTLMSDIAVGWGTRPANSNKGEWRAVALERRVDDATEIGGRMSEV